MWFYYFFFNFKISFYTKGNIKNKYRKEREMEIKVENGMDMEFFKEENEFNSL